MIVDDKIIYFALYFIKELVNNNQKSATNLWEREDVHFPINSTLRYE